MVVYSFYSYLALLSLSVAFGSSDGPRVRVYNATTSDTRARLDLFLDGGAVAEGVRANTQSGPFASQKAENASLEVRKQGSPEPLLDIPLNLKYDDHVVVLIGNIDHVLEYADLGISFQPPPDGQPQVGVLNAVPKETFGTEVDLYVVKPDADLSTSAPNVKSFAYKASNIATVAPGTYKIFLTKAGTTDVLYSSSTFTTKVKERRVMLVLPGSPARTVSIELGVGVGAQ